MRLSILAALFATSLFALSPQPVEPGVTRLLDDLRATVGYRLFSATQETILGEYWQGADRASGAAFQYFGAPENGRRAVFMHCPYAKGPGTTFAEFPLALPGVHPLELQLAVALRRDAPDSDGVTYRVLIDGKEGFQTLCTWKEPREFTVDLAAYAGQTVALRLTVDPGPNQNTRDDWSLWYRADLVAGTPRQIAAAEAQAKARQAAALAAEFTHAEQAAQVDLGPLSGPEARDFAPTPLGPVRSQTELLGQTARFSFTDATDAIVYELLPAKTLAFQITVNGQTIEPLPFRLAFRPLANRKPVDVDTVQVTQAERLEDGAVHWQLAVQAGGESLPLSLRVRPLRKSLVIELQAAADLFAGSTIERRGGVPVPCVYEITPTTYYPDSRAYASLMTDPWHSNASSVGTRGNDYSPRTDGSRNPLFDRYALTVSTRYEETIPNVPHAPSPFLPEFAGRVMLDLWSGGFADDVAWLEQMAGYGLDHFLIIKHVWQRDGYDRTYPDVMPANARQGGDAGLRQLADTARRLGHRFCVHENFYDYYPNAESFRETDCALLPDGKKVPGYAAGPVDAFILKPSLLLDYAQRFSPEAERRYGCTAAYHDIMPTWKIDFDANVPDAGMIRYTHEQTRRLCNYDRELYGGPVFFEAADKLMAGVYDGGTSMGKAIERYPFLPATELLRTHVKMSNHGMSYYERWLDWGYGAGWAAYLMTDLERDKYRAMTVAFGRTGFIGKQTLRSTHAVVREFYLMQAFARAYTSQPVRYLQYERNGHWLDGGTAARHGASEHLRVVYDGQQEVVVNSGSADFPYAGQTLPQYGTFTRGPRATAWTALVDGQRADYAAYDDVVYADARSEAWAPPQAAGILAKAVQFEDLGAHRFRVAVRWQPQRTASRDLKVFWHFRTDETIAFQSDHRPKSATTTWRPGQSIMDGPFDLQIPETLNSRSFTMQVGLYGEGGREELVPGGDTLTLGTVTILADNTLRFAPSASPFPPGCDAAPYRAGLNRDRRVLRFPTLATNGAIVCHRTDAGELLTPVPMTETITVGLPGEVKAIVSATDGTAAKLTRREGWTYAEIGGRPGSWRVER